MSHSPQKTGSFNYMDGQMPPIKKKGFKLANLQ